MHIRDIKLILVPTDFGPPSERALDLAIEVARLTNAEIEVLHVNTDAIWLVPPPGDMLVMPIDVAKLTAETELELDAVVSRVKAAGIPCTGVSQTGRTDAEIVDYARKREAGLIVVGSHGRHGLAHALSGSVAEKVVRHAPCPVLVVHAASAPEGPPRVVAGFDSSPGARAALALAVDEAVRVGGEVEVLACYSVIDDWRGLEHVTGPGAEEIRAYVEQSVAAAVQDVAAGRRELPGIRTSVELGPARDVLVAHARGA